MTVLNIPNTLRATAVAVALAGTAFTAMPVQANHLDVDVGVSIGTPGFSFRFGNDFDRCMSNREVRRDLRADGYYNISFTDRRGRIVELVADLRRPGRDRAYEIAYDTCRGRIVDRDRIG
jgi:hypothetical protein